MKTFLTLSVVAFAAASSVHSSASYASSNAWLPAVENYISHSNGTTAINPVEAFNIEPAHLSNTTSLFWQAFGGDNYQYHLEYQLEGSTEWLTFYTGTENYIINYDKLPSGQYSFRVACEGIQGCPASGYLTQSIDLVHEPSFVSAAYQKQDGSVHVNWENLPAVVGYSLEQSVDNGGSWQSLAPAPGTGVDYASEGYTGTLHSENKAVVSANVVQQAIVKANAHQAKLIASQQSKSKQSIVSTKTASTGFDTGTQLKYRVKACADVACGKDTQSQVLTIPNYRPLIPDPSFEQGNVQFSQDVWSTVGATLSIDRSTPVVGNKSLNIKLKNYAFTYYIHEYTPGSYPVLSGITLSSRIKINDIDKDSKISIYPVAYYDSSDGRVEGQKIELDYQDIGETFDLSSQLWLNPNNVPENQIKRVYFLVRLIGEGSADIDLDDTQLYEGAGLSEKAPSLSSFISDYDGKLTHRWSNFLEGGATYHLEYREEKGASWSTHARTTGTTFSNAEALPSGVYHYRLSCIGKAGCPADGYVKSTSVVVLEPSYITVKNDVSNNKTIVDWADTVSAFGYALYKSVDSGATWANIKPAIGESQRDYSAANENYTATLFTNAKTEFSGISSDNVRYKVKACRYSRCTQFKESTTPFDTADRPLDVLSFRVDNPEIKPGESITLSWQRPANFSEDYSYNIYVTKPTVEGTSPEQPFIWQKGIKVHAISRGGAFGIQREGIHTFEIEACDAQSRCSANKQKLTVEVVGPPPAPIVFSSEKLVMPAAQETLLSWQMSPNYLNDVKFNLFVEKPDGTGPYQFSKNQQGTSFNRLINMHGVHTFYVETCRQSDNVCAEYRPSTKVLVSAIYKGANGDVYVIGLPDGKVEPHYLQVSTDNNERVLNKLSKATWDNAQKTIDSGWTYIASIVDGYQNIVLAKEGTNELIELAFTGINYELKVSNEVYFNSEQNTMFIQLLHNGKPYFAKLVLKQNGRWQVEVMASKEAWEGEIVSSGAVLNENYSIVYGDFTGSELQDARIQTSNETVLVTLEQDSTGFEDKGLHNLRKVLFIHTDLLGSPVAETDIEGKIQ